MELNGNQVWNNGEDWLLCVTLAAGRSLDESQQILSPPNATKMEDLLARNSSLGKPRTKTPGTHWKTSYPKTCDLLFSSPCVLQNLRERERELTAQQALVSRLRADEGTHRDSHQQSHPVVLLR